MLARIENEIVHHRKQRIEGLRAIECQTQREEIHAVADERAVARRRLPRRRDASDQIALPAQAMEQREKAGEQRGKNRRAMCGGKFAECFGKFRRKIRSARGRGECAMRQTCGIRRESKRRGRSGESREPPCRSPSIILAADVCVLLPGIFTEAQCCLDARGASLRDGGVNRSKFAGDNRERPAVADNVVRCEDQQMSGIAELQKTHPKQRRNGEIKCPLRVACDAARDGFRLHGASEVREIVLLEIHRNIRMDDLPATVRANAGAQCIVALYQFTKRRAKRAMIERTADAKRDGIVERGARLVTELRREEDFRLRMSERNVARRDGRRCVRGLATREQIRTREHAHAFLERNRDALDVGIRVRGAQETRTVFPCVNPAQPHVEKDQRRVAVLGCEREVVHRAELLPSQRHTVRCETCVHPRGERACLFREAFLQRRAVFFQRFEHGAGSGEGERVPHKCAREKCHADFGKGIVAVVPRAAIERVHEFPRTRNDADRHAAADDFAISGEVGFHAEIFLRTAGRGAEAGHDFVEDERGSRISRELSQRMEEFTRCERGMAALHRLDHDGGEFARVRAKPCERFIGAVFEDDEILHCARGDAGRDRRRAGAEKHFVEDPVVCAGEDRDFVPPRDRAREAQRGGDGLAAGIAKGHAIEAEIFSQAFGKLSRERGRGADLDAAVKLALDRGNEPVRSVAKQNLTEAECDVGVFVAFGIPQLRARAPFTHERIDHLLPLAAESSDRARIREVWPMRGNRGL